MWVYLYKFCTLEWTLLGGFHVVLYSLREKIKCAFIHVGLLCVFQTHRECVPLRERESVRERECVCERLIKCLQFNLGTNYADQNLIN